MKRIGHTLRGFLEWVSVRLPHRIIIDNAKSFGDFGKTDINYSTSLLKEQCSREHIFGVPGTNLQFLDVGARDGKLEYLLGITKNLAFDKELYEKNSVKFYEKYRYFGCDIQPCETNQMLIGDICDEHFLDAHSEYREFFDVVYSNNVFEHLKEPWGAARNIMQILKFGGICITIAPFSIRYHESPGDYFRFTHQGLVRLFERVGKVETLTAGYDITGRRNDWQGIGVNNDVVPTDHFGAWRENWFAVAVVRKLAS